MARSTELRSVEKFETGYFSLFIPARTFYDGVIVLPFL
jgi:hypothetical protein